MIRKSIMKFTVIIILLALSIFCAYSAETVSDEFNIVFSKVGVSRFYFSEAGKPDVVMKNAVMPLLEGENKIASTDIGVVWELYPSDADTAENMKLSLIFSSDNTVAADTDENYMMRDISGSDTGFNYDAQIIGSSLVLGSDDYNKPIAQSNRRLTLFEGLVSPIDTENGAGDATVNLSIDTDKIAAVSGTYRGYLILYLESY